ncbi:lysozyme inhibitor LprI family protein [Paucibacter sp. TC2R-5]|uniref:lysozyme inhibitor LprI family protein n=1 Tax=Paucibacter sp. TC2R-5 TaxID=2893555 RepID=UPI0039DFB23F
MPCVDAANTVEKNLCLGREVEVLDKAISAQVSRVDAVLRKRDADEPVVRLEPAFASSQVKWRQFRDAECSFRSLSFGSGTGATAEHAFCKMEHGRLRLSHLQGLQ